MLLDEMGLPTHISAFGEASDGAFGSPAGVAAAACLPKDLFSGDGQTDDSVNVSTAASRVQPSSRFVAVGMPGGYEEQLPPGFLPYNEPYNADAEGQWAAVKVAHAGLADYDHDDTAYLGACATSSHCICLTLAT